MQKKNYFKFLALLVMTVGGMQPASATFYNAKSVIINTGSGSGENFNYTLLGENSENKQIWGWIKETDKRRYTYWVIDNGKKLSKSTDFDRGHSYYINDSYVSLFSREIGSVKNQSYFLKVNSQTSANVIYCTIGADISSEASDFYVEAKTVASLSECSLNGKIYNLKISYKIDGPTDALFKNIVVESSYDEGATWTKVGEYTTKSSYYTATVPWNKTKIRYRLTAYPQDCYRSVVKGGCWTYTTADWSLKPTGISCAIDKTSSADELKYSYDADDGTFKPEITWSSSDNMTQAFKSANLYYSYDKGNNWILAKTVTTAAGKDTISVVPGYTSYMFRITETPIDVLADVDAFKPSATVQGPEVSYSPAIESVTLAGKVTDGYNETDKTYTHTVKVAINPDLLITMKNTDTGYINYTTDGGETWSDSIPVWVDGLTVRATITVPVKDSYQYRFSANSYVDGTATAFTATSDVYTADDPSGIDAVAADGDNSPVDVYNLAGKIVARQVVLSKASDVLSNGIYVVKGKIIVINK